MTALETPLFTLNGPLGTFGPILGFKEHHVTPEFVEVVHEAEPGFLVLTAEPFLLTEHAREL